MQVCSQDHQRIQPCRGTVQPLLLCVNYKRPTHVPQFCIKSIKLFWCLSFIHTLCKERFKFLHQTAYRIRSWRKHVGSKFIKIYTAIQLSKVERETGIVQKVMPKETCREFKWLRNEHEKNSGIYSTVIIIIMQFWRIYIKEISKAISALHNT